MTNHLPTLSRTRAIHAALDEAVPVVNAHPEIAFVYVENTYADSWEPRYELADGRTCYTKKGVAWLIDSGEPTPVGLRTHGGVRFEAREVSNWLTMKQEMAEALTSAPTPALLRLVAWWDHDTNRARSSCLSSYDLATVNDYGFSRAKERG